MQDVVFNIIFVDFI